VGSDNTRNDSPVNRTQKGSFEGGKPGAPLAELSGEASHPRFRLRILLATGLGVGYSPVAPGTLGAIVGVGIYCALLPLGALPITVPLVSVALFVVGTYLSFTGERYFREKDCQKIVIDEIASFPLTMAFLSPDLPRIALAFVLNRAADILKPFPAGRIQKLKGGWGVMLDDTVAAIYANLLLRLLILLFKV
jgi:phosphatidylglycerophosphatase A